VRDVDERAFEAIYDRYHEPLLGFCRHMLGSREEAEDALQQVFVDAHRHMRAGRTPEHLKAWLYTIARNRCVSMLRARRDAVALDAVPEPSTDGLAVAGEVERREELEELLGDLARLPDDQRAALVLSEIGDLSHDEVAVALGVRRAKVKALVFQARETLGTWRAARSASCEDIREDLATLRGSALRRASLRRHVAVCPSCAAFEAEVARQRSAMALLLPVAPGLALKHTVLEAVRADVAVAVGAAGTTGAAGVAGLTAAGGSGLTAKALTVAALALGAGGAGTVAVRELDPPRPPAPAAAIAPPRAAEEGAAGAATAAAAAVRPAAAGAERGFAGSGAADPPRGRSAAAPGHAAGKARGRSAQAPGHTAERGRSAQAPGRTKAPGTPATPERGRRLGTTKAPRPAPAQRPARTPPARTAPARTAPVRPAPATSQRPDAVVKPPKADKPHLPGPASLVAPGRDGKS
jgi:RNA polymerase sigma factor (sigma-70 family)